MPTTLQSKVRLSSGSIVSVQAIIGAEYYPKGSLRSDALLRGCGEHHQTDFLFVNMRDKPLRIAGESALRDTDLLEAAGVPVYRRPLL